MGEMRFVKYDGNTIVDLQLVESWVISNGNVDLLLDLLNSQTFHSKILEPHKNYEDCNSNEIIKSVVNNKK